MEKSPPKPFFKRTLIKRMLIITGLLILGGIALFAFLLERVLPYVPIAPVRQKTAINLRRFPLSIEKMDIEAEKDLILKGLLVKSSRPRATLILVHGIGGNKEGYLDFAKSLAEKGFNAFIYDQRAHGESGGAYCTFGFYEKFDVQKIVDSLQKRDKKLPIGIFGASLGGAVALQSLANDKRLAFGIIESTFNTLENVVAQYGKNYVGFRSEWLASQVLRRSAGIAHFDPFSVKPEEACKSITQPIFFAHGTKDERIPIEFNKKNYENTASIEKEFHEIIDAHHNDLHAVGGEKYAQLMQQFLEKQVAPMPKTLSFNEKWRKRMEKIQFVVTKTNWQRRMTAKIRSNIRKNLKRKRTPRKG
jgi:pimeloyl-ACP methyl ester carboxylesterase